MRKLSYTSGAREKLASILEYLTKERGSLEFGHGFTRRLEVRCEELAALPGTLRRERPELRAGLRSVSYKGYVIFFRYRGDVFEVVSVLEGHRDLAAYFDEVSDEESR